ncbi:hypothetical protein SAMN04488029_1089 [Reichenbachiella faecimaris]|uniref:GLPGLI family protein n=1 Tax=Reichenbachiella faecimaris TaxID=692418 RepID=A0A1W2G8T0_REIFA|nr:hypothetical protein [Reichenbachiella faecimaris]SMD32738.1 hypothetical protein SAMN04488029_1089 [Reichenbachiella faecimaris]
MIKINLTLLVFLVVQASFAQVNESVTLNYFDISLSSEIYATVAPNATLENIANDMGSDVGGALGETIAEFPTTGNEKSDQLRNTVYTEIENLTYQAFSEQLKITIEPKEKLQGKISYFGHYPHLFKFKKVLKNAPGEDFYMSYQVDMYKGGMGVGAMGVQVGGKIKPTTVIRLAIADSKGKVVQEFEIKEKTDIVVGSTKTSVGNVEVGNGESPEDVSAKVLQVYQDALNVLIEEFQKKNKKAYKNA